MSTGLFSPRLLPFLTALVIALAATVTFGSADARMGGGGSFGNRGSRTFSMPSATSVAPQVSPFSRPTTPSSGFNTGFGNNGFSRPGLFGGGGFGRGLLGGFLGAGLFGMLFGGGFGGGLGGGASLIGLILQLGLLYLAFRFIMGVFTRGQPAFGGGASAFGGSSYQGGMPNPNYGAAPIQTTPITIGPEDYQTFERHLVNSQQAYSNGDLGTLRRVSTPEMAGNFQEELASNDSQGVVNRLSDVHLLQGDLSEAWREQDRDYATVAMRFSLIDVTQEKRTGRIVSGNPSVAQIVTEIWTFVRPASAGADGWTLSGIQQPN